MSMTFAANLTKMIDAGLGGELIAPDTSVAVGYRMQYNLVSGPVASWNDPEGGLPVSIVTAIEPIQDLHGQAYPYPAGGGRNLFDKASASNGYITATGEVGTDSGWLASDYIGVTSGDYIASKYAASGSGVYLAVYNDQKEFIRSVVMNAGLTRTTSVTIASGETYVRISVRKTQADMAQFEKGTIATEYMPYSNICPISGRADVNIWHDATHDTSSDPTLTIQLGQTVYGGRLDVTNGVLTVDWEIVNLGNLTWTLQSDSVGPYFRTNAGRVLRIPSGGRSPMICSNYPTVSSGNVVDKSIARSSGATDFIYLRDTTYETVEAFKTAMDGVMLAYPVKAAYIQTIQLLPQTINSLKGQNNVWSDAGDVSVTWKEKFYTEGY